MPQLLIYNSWSELPHELARQIRAVLLTEWPGPGWEESEEPVSPALHPTYFILVEGNQLLSFARTIWARITQQGQLYKLYGLGDVVTVPQYRNRGFGSQIVEAATTHIRSDPEADAALLLTDKRREELYRRSGWEYVSQLRVMTDEDESKNAFPMMLFLSSTARASFASQALILPGDEW